MAARAAFEADRRMLEGERASLVAVACQATGLVGGEQLRHGWPDGSVRVVAIDAGHGALGHSVMVRPLELRPDAYMAAPAQFVDRQRCVRDNPGGAVRVDFVTGCARDLVLEVAAKESTRVSRLIEVAGEAKPVGFYGAELRRIADVGG
jgi:hypothetical protein